MKIKTIEDMEKLFNEGKLTHFVVSDECKDVNYHAYTYGGKKLKIEFFEALYIVFELDENRGGYMHFYDVDLEETEKLIKGEKEMTKSDLKDGMVAENRKGNRMFVLSGCFILEKNTHDPISYYNNNLKNIHHEELDIIKVYKTYANDLNRLFKDENLELIWERKEKSEAEIKLDSIEKQIEELQKSAKELREEIKK